MAQYLIFSSAILSVIAFNTGFYFFIFIALTPFFVFLLREKALKKMLLGTLAFRFLFSLGTVYFVIDPLLWFFSLIIFLGLPLSVFVIRKYFGNIAALALLPILWTLWDYLEAQYTALPMTLITAGSVLAKSPFLGLARLGGIIFLIFFAALINALIAAAVLNWRRQKIRNAIAGATILVLFIGWALSSYFISLNREAYWKKQKVLAVDLVSADYSRNNLDGSFTSLPFRFDSKLVVLPETLYRSNLENAEKIIDYYQQFAKEIKKDISAVSLRKDSGKLYKSGLLFSADGELIGKYDKVNLTITSEYWPFGNWKLYFNDNLLPPERRNIAVFDSRYQYAKGTPLLIIRNDYSFANPICLELHYPKYLSELNKLNPDFFIHNSNNDWIRRGLNQYLRLTNNLRIIEAVALQKPVLVSGIRDYAGIIYPDGTNSLIYNKKGITLAGVEVRF